jgi:IclR family transcriptional regulator, KDG regulon repressor
MKSLKKALNILGLLLENGNEMALGEISRITGINKSTTSKIAADLVEYGYLKQQEKRGKYSLGTIYFKYVGTIKSKLQLRSIVFPYVEKLSQQLHESVIVAFGNRPENMFLESFHEISRPVNTLRVIPSDEGSAMPLYCTCLGKMYLAHMTVEEQNRYLNRNDRQRHTPNTLIDAEEIKQHILTVRQEGVSFDDEEHSLGVRGVAAAIIDGEDKLAGCISILAPSVRLTRARMRKMVPNIKACAVGISREIGFKG